MKTRLRSEKLKEDLSGISQSIQTARRVSKRNLLPDQQSEKKLCYNLRQCCVKIRRLRLKRHEIPLKDKGSIAEEKSIQSSEATITTITNAKDKQYSADQCQKKRPVRGLRRCVVRIPRLQLNKLLPENNNASRPNATAVPECEDYEKSAKSTKVVNEKEKENENPNTNAGECSRVSGGSRTIHSVTEDRQLEENASRRYVFRNPALALTRRKAREKGVRESSVNDAGKTLDSEHNDVNNFSLFKPSKNSRRHSLTDSNTACSNFNKSSETPEENLSYSKVCEPALSSEIPLARRDEQNKELENKSAEKQRKVSKTKTNGRRKPQKSIANHKGISSECDIYEFLSQSQTSESDENKQKDPAADIIKKLIEQGRVAVTKNCKGIPRIVHRAKNSKKKATLKKYQGISKRKNNVLKSQTKFQPQHAIINEDKPDQFVNDDVEVISLVPETPIDSGNEVIRNNRNVNASTSQGTFSNLARSVLIQQTNNTSSAQKGTFNKKRLLEITQKNISTPLPKSRSSIFPQGVNLSPIPKTTTSNKDKTVGNASIKNVNLEENSFYMHSLPNEISNLSRLELNSPRAIDDPTNNKQQSSLSSFSSNDSNAENMPPPSIGTLTNQNDENANVFNTRQTLNPRRTLPNRSPLKAINIIDVITLPPYRGIINAHEKEKVSFEVPVSDADQSNSRDESNQPLFGFEEYLDEDLEASNNNNENTNTSSSRRNLHQKLKKLQKWRPNIARHKDAKSSTITKHIFDDDLNKKRGHHDIRNMLCSTMINAPPAKPVLFNDSDDSDESLTTTSKQNEGLDLFGDPETTFDQNRLHRTYERPFKRKRKLQHQYSVILESADESENEDEHNTSVTKVTKRYKKNRKHREECPKAELEEFVSNFNSMLKEAEDYELIVE